MVFLFRAKIDFELMLMCLCSFQNLKRELNKNKRACLKKKLLVTYQQNLKSNRIKLYRKRLLIKTIKLLKMKKKKKKSMKLR